MADVPRGWNIFTKPSAEPYKYLKTHFMAVNLEISWAFECFTGSRGSIGVNLIEDFCAHNSKDSPNPAAQMVTAGWPHPTNFIFTGVNYAENVCWAHKLVHSFSLIRLHIFTLGSCPVQPQSSAYCPPEQIMDEGFAQGHFNFNSLNLNKQILPNRGNWHDLNSWPWT